MGWDLAFADTRRNKPICSVDRMTHPVATHIRRLLPVIATLALATSCGSGPGEGHRLIERAGGAQRLRDAALQVQRYASPDKETIIPEASWPEEFRVLAPESVSVDASGAYVTMHIDTIDAYGLYVIFDIDIRPQDLGVDLSFEPLAPGIYWYRMIMGG
jgi:hypothetical protein